jgi:NADH-quinone oxidoreductase subunit H
METVLAHPLFIPVVMTVAIIAVFPLLAGYIVLVERKVLADMQVRLGPMRVGPHGLLQPIADAVKLLMKEDLIPAQADRAIFWLAPVISTFTALTCFAVLPFSSVLRVADVNVGVLIIAAMSAIGVLGIILGGWASNSHYPLLGALRGAAQLVSYEVALALGMLSAVMCAGTLSMVEIVKRQQEQGIWFVFDNFGFMIVPFVIYFIAATAETNRAPFDLPEAESELVAGFMTEYSGFRWALFFLAEYANMVVVSAVATTLFWGGWLRPFPNVGWLEIPFNYGVPLFLFVGSGVWCFPMASRLITRGRRIGLQVVGVILILIGLLFLWPAANQAMIGLFWFFFKVFVAVYSLIWFRGTWPRFRYDQLMDIGWKVLIPLGLAALLINALLGMI